MQNRMTKLIFCLSIYLSLVLSNIVDAHDLDEIDPEVKWNPARLSYMPEHGKPKIPSGIFAPSYVIGLPNRWSISQTIHICFVGGTDELRNRIIEVSRLWFQHANLTPDYGGISGVSCGQNDKSEIRIGFSEPGYWSYVGNDSLNPVLIAGSLTSLNLQGFDTTPPPEPRFTGIVLHELGHALGFEHEHQSPASGCDKEYNWPKLYAYYQRVYQWDKTMVDQNVRQLLADSSAYSWSSFDPNSIMIYSSDPQFLFKGASSPCFLHDNNSLSELDIKGVEATYPRDGVPSLLGSRVIAISEVLTRLPSGSLKNALKIQLESTKKQVQQLQLSK